MDNPAPAERKAVLDTMLLPGSESRIDLATSLGSFEGTLDSARRTLDVWRVVAAGRTERKGRAGRTRAAPIDGQWVSPMASLSLKIIMNIPIALLAMREAIFMR